MNVNVFSPLLTRISHLKEKNVTDIAAWQNNCSSDLWFYFTLQTLLLSFTFTPVCFYFNFLFISFALLHFFSFLFLRRSNERTNERRNEGRNERTNKRTNKRTNERTNERANEGRNERTNERTNEGTGSWSWSWLQ